MGYQMTFKIGMLAYAELFWTGYNLRQTNSDRPTLFDSSASNEEGIY
jgi:hypothetical protein